MSKFKGEDEEIILGGRYWTQSYKLGCQVHKET